MSYLHFLSLSDAEKEQCKQADLVQLQIDKGKDYLLSYCPKHSITRFEIQTYFKSKNAARAKQLYHYREQKFRTLTAYTGMQRVLLAAFDKEDKILGCILLVEFC